MILSCFLLSIFVLSLAGLVHSYFFYPLLLKKLAARLLNSGSSTTAKMPDEWPVVSVLMAVYNEESVIAAKLRSLEALDYPVNRIWFFIGSDNSSDQTNAIVEAFAANHKKFVFTRFSTRQGKPGVINQLSETAFRITPPGPNHILFMTDANVFLEAATLKNLVRHFQHPDTALVDARVIHTGIQSSGISRSENHYISREVWLKHHEGQVWGKMMGPFGGCYVLRSDYFTKVPPNYLVDDFYIAMRALEKGGAAINDLDARCFEPISHDWREEFRRKSRISAGNFQNLKTFFHLWWPPVGVLGFAFFSHKVLRWLGPFLILGVWLSAGLLALNTQNFFWPAVFCCISGTFLLAAFLDAVLGYVGIHWLPARSMRYFLLMNIALLSGFFKYLKGVKNNVWEPTKRDQNIPA